MTTASIQRHHRTGKHQTNYHPEVNLTPLFSKSEPDPVIHIGVNDIHIAGHARSEGLALVTNNVAEFIRVPALEVENWVSRD